MKLEIKEPTTRTTNPKLPIEQNNSISANRPATTMKFNWKANWEILLVLVIIVVGIVITTIAAVRSKDKHLLVLPEETDYGQLLAGGGGSSSEQIAPVPPLQQTDFQLQNAQVLTSSDDDTQTTRRPARTKASTQPANNLEQAASKTTRHNSTGMQHHNNHLLPLNPSARSRQDGKHNHQSHHHHHHHQQHNSKHDEGDFHVGAHDNDHKQQQLGFGGSSSASHDNYDALSTEPTPSQVRGSELPTGQDLHKAARPSKGRHNVHRPRKDNGPPADASGADPLEEPVDVVDDIHTTRSLLASNRPNHSFPDSNSNSNNNNNDNNSTGSTGIPAPLFDQSTMSVTPSLAMHGPYGITSAPLLNTHQFNSNAQLQALLAQHASNNKLEPPILEQDDMMTSYSRMPSASNISDAIMRDYNLASAANSTSSLLNSFLSNGELSKGPLGGGQEGLNGGGPSQSANSPPATVSSRHRLHTAAALPFSVLLSDLIKLTRPASSAAAAASAFEQPANTRPQQQSILQQLRSLPGPLLSLLQVSSGPSGAVHESGPSSSHDASESSPHYQRISMSPTEMHSILSRSLRSTGVLPAFPAPKDAPDTWIPPTAGGSATVHDAMNSNADFVASNVAGFVRPSGQQQPQASSNLGHQTSDLHNQYQPAQDTPSQLQDEQSLPQQQQIPNQSQGHFISIEQHQAQRQAQQQQQQQQHHHQQQQQIFAQQHQPLISPSQQQQQQQQPIMTHDNIRQDYHHQPQQTQQSPQIALGAQMRGNVQLQMMNQRPIYITRPISEIQVPLGYNPSASIQQHQQQPFAQGNQPQAMRRALELVTPVELASKATMTSSIVSPVDHNPTGDQASKSTGQPANVASVPVKRLKRAASGALGEIEMAASRDNPSEEEEFLDSRPVSIVRPDGRPMSGDILLGGRVTGASKSSQRGYSSQEHQSGRAGEADLPSPSLRKANHLDFDALSHYASSYKRQADNRYKNGLGDRRLKMIKRKKKLIGMARNNKSKLSRFNTASDSKSHTNLALDAAGSGLMSKLLGTASNIDDVEEDVDGDDEDSANERRKEELEDAEFGLVNDERNNQPDGPQTTLTSSLSDGAGRGPSSGGDEAVSRANNEEGGNDSSSHLGSGSTDSEAYARRNQQRSDIEFYGHPGEETRQLKYGILGSGNYEVVNGGIYPEADESTAAVNSVANYVRKPGALLIAGLPKLMAHHHQHHHQQQQAAAPFMPGGRIGGGVGGYMRGASAAPEDIVGHLMPGVDANKALSSPLLDLIDAQGGSPLFDPNLVAHLGSSGTSARTTHASQEGDANDGDHDKHKAGKRKKHHQYGEARMNNNKDQKLQEEAADDGAKSTAHNKKLADYGKLGDFRTSSGRHTQHVAEFDDPNSNEQDTRSSSIDSNRQALNTDYKIEHEEGNHKSRLRDDEYHSSGNRDQPSKSQGTNQFNSYQILPSKKVTIFSDQDLDSAPSSVKAASHLLNDWHPQHRCIGRGCSVSLAARLTK